MPYSPPACFLASCLYDEAGWRKSTAWPTFSAAPGPTRPYRLYLIHAKGLTIPPACRLPYFTKALIEVKFMRKLVVLTFLSGLCASAPASTQEVQKPAAPAAGGPLTGRWTASSDFHGTPLYFKLELAQEGGK